MNFIFSKVNDLYFHKDNIYVLRVLNTHCKSSGQVREKEKYNNLEDALKLIVKILVLHHVNQYIFILFLSWFLKRTNDDNT